MTSTSQHEILFDETVMLKSQSDISEIGMRYKCFQVPNVMSYTVSCDFAETIIIWDLVEVVVRFSSDQMIACREITARSRRSRKMFLKTIFFT